MAYQLSDIHLLSTYERAEFRQQRGITTSISAQAFFELINSPGPVTLASQDLLTAKLSPKLEQSLSVKAVLNLNLEQLQELALSLGLDSNISNLVQRVLRVLRFKQQLIYDYNFVFPTEPIPLTELVCGQLKLGPDFFESFRPETIQASFFQQLQVTTPTKVCNLLSGGIATNLVRVAATRIFGDPTRSFLEPIVNSIDAYRVKQGLVGSTGKFGLGFYSLLYWLVGRDLPEEPADLSEPLQPNRKLAPRLILQSTYLDFTGELVTWTGGIYEDQTSRQLVIELAPQTTPSDQPTQSGQTVKPGLTLSLELFYLARPEAEATTTVKTIIPLNQNQQFDSYQAFDDLATALDAVNDASILLGYKYLPDVFLTQPEPRDFDRLTLVGSERPVDETNHLIKATFVDLPVGRVADKVIRAQTYQVSDQATGIALTSLGYLLVPSLSSKTISAQTQYSPVVGSHTGFAEQILDFEFHLIVGQILVKTVEFAQEISDDVFDLHYRYDHPKGCRIIVQLSSQAQLPVARDDIILNPWVKAELELNLLALLDQALSQNPRYYVNLLLMALVKYTTASYFIPVLLQKLQDRGILAVPSEYYPYYRTLLQNVDPPVVIYGNNTTLNLTTEDLILSWLPGDATIFLGRQVYHLDPPIKTMPTELAELASPESEVTTAKSSRLLFLPSSTVLTPDRVADLALLYQSQGLIPLGSDWLSQGKKRQLITELASQFTDPVINSVVVNILTALSGLKVNYQLEVNPLLANFVKTYQPWQIGQLAAGLPRVLGYYIKYLSLLKPNYAYGDPQYELEIGLEAYIPPANLIVPGATAKLIEYYLDYLERTVQRLAETNTLMIGAAVSFVDFQVGHYFNLTNDVIEFLYLNLISQYFSPDSRIEQPNQAELAALVKYWRGHLGSPDKVQEILEVFALGLTPLPILQASEAFLRVHREVDRSLNGVFTRIARLRPCASPNYSYYLSRLIEEAFRGQPRDFYAISRNLSSQPGTLPIQILEIAINEGTTKEPLQAMIIETVQNSLDAARATGVTKPLEISLAQSGQQISYQIKDYVGIPGNGLLSLSIPFLSTKSVANADTAAGEMGSGFFNVYRRASVVNIVTVRDGLETIIVDRPVRNDSGRVLDIARKISVAASTKSNGTTITVYIDSSEPTEEITQMLVICQTLVLAAAETILLNNQVITLPRKLYYTGVNITASYTEAVIESVVLTKGAPFTTLSQFLDQSSFAELKKFASRYITTNLIINLVKGYTPTQSRTAVVLQDQDSLVLDIQSAIFYYILHLQERQPKINHLKNFTTRVSVDQVMPALVEWDPIEGRKHRHDRKSLLAEVEDTSGSDSEPDSEPEAESNAESQETVQTRIRRHKEVFKHLRRFQESRVSTIQKFYDLDDFLWDLVPFGSKVNLSQLVHQYLDQLRAGVKLAQILASLTPVGAADYSPAMVITAINWLKNKDLSEISIPSQKVASESLSAENAALLDFTNRFVRAYWQRLPSQFQGNGPPPVHLAITQLGTLGEYSVKDHSIVLSIGFINSGGGGGGGNIAYNLTAPPTNLTYDSLLEYLQEGGVELFGKRNPAATLIHELEHAWRSSGHRKKKGMAILGNDPSHSNIKLSLNGPAKDYTFDQAANAMYDYVLGQGLLKDLVG